MENEFYHQPKSSTRILFNFSVILFFLLAGFSIFYYLVIFLPGKENARITQQRLEQKAINKSITDNRKALDSCLKDVTDRATKVSSDSKFKNINTEQMKVFLDLVNTQKEECFNKYPLK